MNTRHTNTDRNRAAAERKVDGAHYTPSALAEFVADQIAAAFEAKRGSTTAVLDPAAGDGALLSAMIRALISRGITQIDAVGFDTSTTAIDIAASRLADLSSEARVRLLARDFLHAVHEETGAQVSLFEANASKVPEFDIVIANPPYVRTQVMGAARSQQLSDSFALSGRVDLYFAFIRAISKVLRPGGIAGLIVSNRFMTTQSGASLRQSIPEDFDVLHVFDFGDTRLFEAAVLPAVLLLKRKLTKVARALQTPYVSIYSTPVRGDESPVPTVFDAIQNVGRMRLETGDAFDVKRGHLDFGSGTDAVWRLATKESDDWLATVSSRASLTFGDVGPLRVGIKTTADKVFIRTDWEEYTGPSLPELLRPITTHHTARRFRALDLVGAPKILYTHEIRDGRRRAVDLALYPKTAEYLTKHRAQLEGRSYVRDAGRQWFEIWVPQDPAAWAAPKLVWRDISEEPVFWIDNSGTLVNGDCYWLSAPPEHEHLLWLALAVANSTFVGAFYDHCFNNKLYAGRRRFITQYVRKFPLPDPDSAVAQQMIGLAREIYDRTPSPDGDTLARELDDLTWESFALGRKESGRKRDLKLFV